MHLYEVCTKGRPQMHVKSLVQAMNRHSGNKRRSRCSTCICVGSGCFPTTRTTGSDAFNGEPLIAASVLAAPAVADLVAACFDTEQASVPSLLPDGWTGDAASAVPCILQWSSCWS